MSQTDISQHNSTHLSLGCGHSGPSWVNLLVDGGEEVLRDPQSVLQQWEVGVVFRSVLQQVLQHQHPWLLVTRHTQHLPKVLI